MPIPVYRCRKHGFSKHKVTAHCEACASEKSELAQLSSNSDYEAAPRVFNEWFFNYRGSSHFTEDYFSWLNSRLHSAENTPNVS